MPIIGMDEAGQRKTESDDGHSEEYRIYYAWKACSNRPLCAVSADMGIADQFVAAMLSVPRSYRNAAFRIKCRVSMSML